MAMVLAIMLMDTLWSTISSTQTNEDGILDLEDAFPEDSTQNNDSDGTIGYGESIRKQSRRVP